MDLVFAIDLTGSMFDDIDSVKSGATQIVNELNSVTANHRTGIVTYKDFPVPPFGEPGDFPFRTELPFSTDTTAVISAIQGLAVGGGADTPESVYSALMHAIAFPWRDGATKAIILMGDAPGHDPEPFTGFTASIVLAAAEAVDPAQIFPVLVGFDPQARAQFQFLADGSAGKLFEAPTAADVIAAIIEAIGVIITPTNTSPVCASAIADPPVLWPPNHGLAPVSILGVDDADGDPLVLTLTSITQDEPVSTTGTGSTAPDALGLGSVGGAFVRAERSGQGDGRVYEISFTADDRKGGECAGSVRVAVPHDIRKTSAAVDDGQTYDSTVP